MIIKLHGILKDKFFSEGIEINSNSLSEIMQVLIARFGVRFKDIIEEGQWHIILGSKESETIEEGDRFLEEKFLELPIFEDELHIFPAVIGAGGKGVGKIILGVVLIVIAVVVAWYAAPALVGGYASAGAQVAAGFAYSSVAYSLALAGVMSIAGGVMAMMTKTPTMSSYNSANSPDQRQSFIFNGAVNSIEQGVAVPLVYGRHLTGSTVIYAGMDVEQL